MATDWTLARLQQLAPQELLQLTRQASSDLTSHRLLLGRCLLAMERTRAAHEFGYSGPLHYCNLLGVPPKEARVARLVAERLEELPLLREAAECGTVGWSNLRDVLRKATPETEQRWLGLAQECSYREIEKIVARTEVGSPPDETSDNTTREPDFTRLTLLLPSAVMAMFQQVVRNLSHRAGRLVAMADVLEILIAEHLAGSPEPSQRVMEKLRRQAERDSLAARDREDRLVQDRLTAGEQDPTGNSMAETPIPDPRGSADAPDVDPFEAPWAALAAREVSHQDVLLVEGTRRAHWENTRLVWSGSARLPTAAQRRELLRRDGYCCSVPGCPNRLWLAVHHVVFYCRGGVTVPENLCVVCSACHRNLHRGNLQVSGQAPSALRWTDRHGVELRTGSRAEGSASAEP